MKCLLVIFTLFLSQSLFSQEATSSLALVKLPDSINTSGIEENPMISPDGSTLLFYRNYELFYTLKDSSSNWSNAKRVIVANKTPGYFFDKNSFDGRQIFEPFSTSNTEDDVDITIVSSEFQNGKLLLPRPIKIDFSMKRDFVSGKRGHTISGSHFKENRAFLIHSGMIYETTLKDGTWIEPTALPDYISRKVDDDGLRLRDPVTQDPVVLGDNGLIYATVQRSVKGFKSGVSARIQYFSIKTDGLWSLPTPIMFDNRSEKYNIKITSYSEQNQTLYCEWNGDIYTAKLPDILQEQIEYKDIKNPQKESADVGSQDNRSIGNPTYHALIIGISDYQYNDQDLRDLDFPVQDAQTLKDALVSNYTFEEENIRLLENPNRSVFINALEDLSKRIQPDENLLIFYAGHGIWDEDLKVGYWLAADAKITSKANWIPNSTVQDYLAGVNTKHTLLITDACFSGSIFKTRAITKSLNNASFYRIYKNQSRKAMTSGSLNTVPDKSVFLHYLVKALTENKDNYLPSGWLFHEIERAVIHNTSNTPQYGTIQNTGDEGGHFIFIRKDN